MLKVKSKSIHVNILSAFMTLARFFFPFAVRSQCFSDKHLLFVKPIIFHACNRAYEMLCKRKKRTVFVFHWIEMERQMRGVSFTASLFLWIILMFYFVLFRKMNWICRSYFPIWKFVLAHDTWMHGITVINHNLYQEIKCTI